MLTEEQMRDALRQCPHDTVENLRVRWLYAKDFARAIESAACAERDARIAELTRQLEEARKDAAMLDWLDKQNADIENDAWVVLAHDCAGDEDCKKYWVGADLRGAIRAAIKEQT